MTMTHQAVSAQDRGGRRPENVRHERNVLRVDGLTKSFSGGPTVVSEFGIEVAAGEIVCFLGPSGCGKTTILRMIVGLEKPDSGTIKYGESVLFDKSRSINAGTHTRNFGMVFQSYALWPHMSVRENVAYPLRALKTAKKERDARADDALARVGLGGLGSRKVSQLSGGQQQRVAVARAVVGEPRMVFFDEPLSNLDTNLRTRMRQDIREVMTAAELSGIYVTHDQSEAFAIADRVVVMNRGNVHQVGTPQELVTSPSDAFVAKFLRLGVVLKARLVSAEINSRSVSVEIGGQTHTFTDASMPDDATDADRLIELFVPNSSLRLGTHGIPGIVQRLSFEPDGNWQVDLKVADQPELISISTATGQEPPPVGSITHVEVAGPVSVFN